MKQFFQEIPTVYWVALGVVILYGLAWHLLERKISRTFFDGTRRKEFSDNDPYMFWDISILDWINSLEACKSLENDPVLTMLIKDLKIVSKFYRLLATSSIYRFIVFFDRPKEIWVADTAGPEVLATTLGEFKVKLNSLPTRLLPYLYCVEVVQADLVKTILADKLIITEHFMQNWYGYSELLQEEQGQELTNLPTEDLIKILRLGRQIVSEIPEHDPIPSLSALLDSPSDAPLNVARSAVIIQILQGRACRKTNWEKAWHDVYDDPIFHRPVSAQPDWFTGYSESLLSEPGLNKIVDLDHLKLVIDLTNKLRHELSGEHFLNECLPAFYAYNLICNKYAELKQ